MEKRRKPIDWWRKIPKKEERKRERERERERKRKRKRGRNKRNRGLRRYFAVDAAGSIAWRADRVSEMERDREEGSLAERDVWREGRRKKEKERKENDRDGGEGEIPYAYRMRLQERKGQKTKGNSPSFQHLYRSRSPSFAPFSFSFLSLPSFSFSLSLSLSLSLALCFSTHPLADYACLPSSLVIWFSPSTLTIVQPQESMHPGSLLPAANDPTFQAVSFSVSPLSSFNLPVSISLFLPLCFSFILLLSLSLFLFLFISSFFLTYSCDLRFLPACSIYTRIGVDTRVTYVVQVKSPAGMDEYALFLANMYQHSRNGRLSVCGCALYVHVSTVDFARLHRRTERNTTRAGLPVNFCPPCNRVLASTFQGRAGRGALFFYQSLDASRSRRFDTKKSIHIFLH